MKKNYGANIIQTQVRISEDTNNYLSNEAERLGISKNAVIIKIIDEYRLYRKMNQIGIEPFSRS